MSPWIFALPAVLLAFLYASFLRDTRQRARLVAAIEANPALVESLYQTGPDGDGYVYLYARLKNGTDKWLANYAELKEVLARLGRVGLTLS